MMHATENVPFGARAPVKQLGLCVVAHRPQHLRSIEAIDLTSIDERRVVGARRTKAVPFDIRPGIGEGSRIPNERCTLQGQLERETIIVSVAAAPSQADRAAVNEDMVVLVTHDEEAGSFERGRRNLPLAEAAYAPARLGAERPIDFVERSATSLQEIRVRPTR